MVWWRRRSISHDENEEPRTDWRSIYVLALVAFISNVHSQIIGPAMWPYMKLLIPGVSENFFGLLNSLVAIGSVLSSPIAGYISNYLRDTTWPLLTSKMFAITSCFIYLTIELVGVKAKYALFIVVELIFGFSVGTSYTYRTFVAMESTELDRAKAVAIWHVTYSSNFNNLAPTLAIFVGPLLQLLFGLLGYPGASLLFGLHLNLYTAPLYTIVLICIIGLVLLICSFDGRMRLYKQVKAKQPVSDTQLDANSTSSEDHIGYDKLAFCVCLYTRMLVNFCAMCINIVVIPYSMITFRWTSEKTTLYISISMVLIGINICFWNFLYIFSNIKNRLKERTGIFIAICLVLLAYLLTYPYPFIGGSIPYIDPTDNSTEPLGCKPEFKWCAETPRVNMYLFLGSLIIVLGMAVPLCEINLNILASKVLGNIKQGTLQSFMNISADILTIFSPILFTKVYTLSGPKYLWLLQIGILSISLILWLICFKRMVGKSERLTTVQND
ncbi:hypothetical protein M3Y97_00912800 [Aphelenchoides bicaudatus]|nr:hypothetical protein M3Y97_00912800 [Aphelenchoides bicaudatus]